MRSFLLSVLLFAGCGDDDPGIPDATGPRDCGPAMCAAGEVCCNQSCGICVAPGESCSAIACVPDAEVDGAVDAARDGAADAIVDATVDADANLPPCMGNNDCSSNEYCAQTSCGGSGVCEAVPVSCDTRDCEKGVCGCDGVTYCSACDAAQASVSVESTSACPRAGCGAMDVSANSDGACRDRILGWQWTGDYCSTVFGCSCRGRDCPRIYPSQSSCFTAHATCRTAELCSNTMRCRAINTYCRYGNVASGNACGAEGELGVCTTRPTICNLLLAPVCGCDGRTYNNECRARAAGVDWAKSGGC
ncbi:MAG: hypothetical protein AAGF12_02230 [Myxococcota bacterium]